MLILKDYKLSVYYNMVLHIMYITQNKNHI